jgi:hypothetical protein
VKASLLRALRVVAHADSDASRILLFDTMASRSRVIRMARWATHGPLRGTWPAAGVVGAYGFVSALISGAVPPARQGGIWSLALYENERRQVDYVSACFGRRHFARARLSLRSLTSASFRRIFGLALAGGGLRFLRAVRRICRRHRFHVACRMSSALAGALVAKAALPRTGVRAVLVASDYNAEAVGLSWAARELGLPTVFVAHSHTHALSPPLDFSLAILDGEAALEAYRAKGPVKAAVVFKGIEGDTRPLRADGLARTNPVIGFFLPKEPVWPLVATLLADAKSGFAPARLLVRWHPNAMKEPQLSDVPGVDTDLVEACPRGSSVAEDARRCDWVIADENSNVHLAVLKAGVPTVPIVGLAVFPEERPDYYGFVAGGIVPPARLSLRDFRPESLVPFFAQGWPEQFRRYDAAYASNPEAGEAAVREAVGRAIGETSADPSAPAASTRTR